MSNVEGYRLGGHGSSGVCSSRADCAVRSSAQRGATSDLKVSIEGTLDTTGIDFYSLFASRGDIRGSACIALILTDAGLKKAKALNGKRVIVRGKLLFLADLNTLLPDQSGKINGRIWAGTRCTGESAIYVSDLRTKSGS